MKSNSTIVILFFLLLIFVVAGCDGQEAKKVVRSVGAGDTVKPACAYSGYSPTRISIIPLTEFVSEGVEISQIKVYVKLQDGFGCEVKAPGIFRFEVYERVLRSADPKGKRKAIWRPDIDLTDAAANNNYWRDFLRGYEFYLDFAPSSSQDCILEVTYLGPTGKRLSAEYTLKLSQ